MSNLALIEKMLTDVTARIESLPVAPTEEALKGMIKTMMDEVFKDPDLARKMRFGQPADAPLLGSKFARHGLSISDVEWLFDIQTALKGERKGGGGTYEGPSEALTNCFDAISDAIYIPQEEIKRIDHQAIDGLFPRVQRASMNQMDQAIRRANAMKAMDSAESGFGSQLVGAQYVADLWEAARRESIIFQQLNSFEMLAATAYLPVEVDFPEMLFVAESSSSSASNFTTSKTGSQKVQVDAKKFVIHQMWSGELEEDSIIPFVPFLRMQIAKALSYYLDSLVLNGDTTNAGTGNINLDDADPADTKHYLAFDGIRHAALVDNTANKADCAGAITYRKILAQNGRMVDATNKVDWGHPADPNDLIRVCDIDTGDRIAELDEVLTVDKYKDNATILTGEVSKIGRNPLLVSMAMSKTEADGKLSTTGGNNTLGQLAAFNRKAFVPGWRRRVRTEVERLPGTDQTRLVYSLRLGFGRFSPSGAASGIEAADVLYNIAVT